MVRGEIVGIDSNFPNWNLFKALYWLDKVVGALLYSKNRIPLVGNCSKGPYDAHLYLPNLAAV